MNQQDRAHQHSALARILGHAAAGSALQSSVNLKAVVVAGALLASAVTPVWASVPVPAISPAASQPLVAPVHDAAQRGATQPVISAKDVPVAQPGAKASSPASATKIAPVAKKPSAPATAATVPAPLPPRPTAAAQAPVAAPALAPAAAPAKKLPPAPAPAPAPKPVVPVPQVRTIYVAGAGGQALVDQCIGPIHFTPTDGYSLFITEHDFCGGWDRFSGIQVGERVDLAGYGSYTVAARGQVPNGGTTNDVAAVFGGFPRAVLQTCIPGTSQMLVIALN
ncbi:hypothetical protein [Arthrobacter sp. ISL-28]|uniref:hypothetical protein n=1 Tax=Arthrobacter sp. ISL-28 TaxID=2819108 RepID=UPI002034B421|nr:hypothetical protein [Arthrobacter sp. ISL-28]